MLFFKFKPCLNYPSPCPRIIFECEVTVWGWKPVRFTNFSNHQLTGVLLCASDIADLQGGCMILWDTFFWDSWIIAPSTSHAIQHVKLISIPSWVMTDVPIEHHPTMNGIWSTRWLLEGDVQYSQNGTVTNPCLSKSTKINTWICG